MNPCEMLSTEELCKKWPIEGPDPIRRWWLMLHRWRSGSRPLLARHVHYEVVYRDSAAVYVYEETRVLHLVWHQYEHGAHPLCTQLMLQYGANIKEAVKAARNGSDATVSSSPTASPVESSSPGK